MSKCELDSYSSRVCEMGTKSCNIEHGNLADEVRALEKEKDDLHDALGKLGNEFDRMHEMIHSRYVAECIFEVVYPTEVNE